MLFVTYIYSVYKHEIEPLEEIGKDTVIFNNMSNKVLVTAATGKVGLQTCRALKSEGFEVYGTAPAVLCPERS